MAKKILKKSKTKVTAKKKVLAIPKGFHTATPYLTVRNGVNALEFYKKAFGAKEIGRIAMGPDKIGHAEIQIGDSKIMLADEFPEWGNKGPETIGGSPVGICLYVKDVDSSFKKAVDAGATVIKPVSDQFYGDRSGLLKDPFGHMWTIATHQEDISFKELQKRSDKMMNEMK
ncbi:MAG: VOC family protein [Bacteriovoracaceae bacterium]